MDPFEPLPGTTRAPFKRSVEQVPRDGDERRHAEMERRDAERRGVVAAAAALRARARSNASANTASLHEADLSYDKFYIDEVDLSFRAEMWGENEDGFPKDCELFIAGIPVTLTEEDLWAHLNGLGVEEIREILLLRHDGKSVGRAYVIFASHAIASKARQTLNDSPSSDMLVGTGKDLRADGDDEGESRLRVWFSESERCAKGLKGVYRSDTLQMLFGSNGETIERIQKKVPGLRSVGLAGGFVTFGGVDDGDFRVHMKIGYATGDEETALKAREEWEACVESMHLRLAEMREEGKLAPFDIEDDDGDLTDSPLEEEEDYDGMRHGDKGGEAEAVETPGSVEACGFEEGADGGGGGRELVIVLRSLTTGEEDLDALIVGRYREEGDHDGRPFFKRRSGNGPEGETDDSAEVFLFWGSRGDGLAGWLFAPQIGSDEIFAENLTDDPDPPEYGWELFCVTNFDVELAVRTNERRRRRRHRRVRRGDVERPEAQGPTPEPPPNVPHPWQAVPHGDVFYYWNEETNETSWTPPESGAARARSRGSEVAATNGTKRDKGSSAAAPENGAMPGPDGEGRHRHRRRRSRSRRSRSRSRSRDRKRREHRRSGREEPAPLRMRGSVAEVASAALPPGDFTWARPHGGAPMGPGWPPPFPGHPGGPPGMVPGGVWGVTPQPGWRPAAHGWGATPQPGWTMAGPTRSDGVWAALPGSTGLREPPPGRSICFPKAHLGDIGLRSWCSDHGADDAGPKLMKRLEQGVLELVDFSRNELTHQGVFELISFLIGYRRPVRKFRLHCNRLCDLLPLCRFFEDPSVGLAAPGLQGGGQLELHLQHNEVTRESLERLFETIAKVKATRRAKSSVFLRIEHNPCESQIPEIVKRVRGLKVQRLEKASDRNVCPADVDVVIFADRSAIKL